MEDEAPSMKYAASGGQGENEEDEVAHWSGKITPKKPLKKWGC